MSTDPRTWAEWQEAVDAAEAMLEIDACKQYGLLVGGPDINHERCRELLARGKAKGLKPNPEEVKRLILSLA